MPSPWQYIPNETIEDEERDKAATRWQQAQRAQLASEWADRQRQKMQDDLREMARQSMPVGRSRLQSEIQSTPPLTDVESPLDVINRPQQAGFGAAKALRDPDRTLESVQEGARGGIEGRTSMPGYDVVKGAFTGPDLEEQKARIQQGLQDMPTMPVGRSRYQREVAASPGPVTAGEGIEHALGLGLDLVADPLNLPAAAFKPVTAGAGLVARGVLEGARGVAPVAKAGLRAAEDVITDPRVQGGMRRLVPGATVEDVSQGLKAVADAPVATAPPTGPLLPESPRQPLWAGKTVAEPPLRGGPPPEPPTGTAPPLPPSPSPASSLPALKSTKEYLEAAYAPDMTRRVLDKIDNPVTRTVGQAIGVPTRDVFTEANVLRQSILADWKSAVTGATAKLRQMGTSSKAFAVKDDMANINGTQVPITDLLEYPDRYALTPPQRDYAATLHQLYDDQKNALLAEGIDVKELAFGDGGHYVGRRVMGKLDDQGDIELAQVGQGIGSRLGAKAGFEKARTFATQEEAVKAGFRYMAPEEALQVNMLASGRKIADKRMADYVLSKIPYRTGEAPESLKTAKAYAQDKLATVGKLKAVINRGYRGERVPPATVKSIGRFFPEAGQGLLDANITKLEAPATNPISRPLLQNVEALLPGLKAQAQQDYYRATSQLARAGEQARAPHYGERMVMAPALQGKFFSEADAKRLSQVLDLEPQSPLRGVARSITWVNALPRLLLTTFDLGPALIQGQVTLLSHPIVWGKAVNQGMRALGSEKGYQSFLATHADTIKNWSRDGAIFTPSEFTETVQQGGMATKIPILREAVKPFARSYEAFLNATRIYGLEATEHMAKSSADRVGLAKFWNEMTGQVDTARMGISATQRELETAIAFAPRYRRAVLTLMTDIAKGGLRGEMARDALGKATVVGLTGYMGVWSIANQVDPRGNPSPHLDPREGGKWLTINIGGQNIGMGGTFYSTTRALAQMALDPGKAHEVAGKYVKNMLSPVVGTTVDAYRYPYLRDTLPKFTKEVVASNLLPIWAQAWLLEPSNAGTPAALIGESMGLRTFPDRENTLLPYKPGDRSGSSVPSRLRHPGRTAPSSRLVHPGR